MQSTETAKYSISDLADITGLKCHTLRIWEKRYGLLKPERTDQNVRFYQQHDIEMLRRVMALYDRGYRISRIAEMSFDQMDAALAITQGVETEDGSQLLESLRELDLPTMEIIMDKIIKKSGFESALFHVFLPFMDSLERMWLSGEIDEAHETCFRELMKRKTLREIDNLQQQPGGKKVIMFLPKGNQQELIHLFMHYLLRKQGLYVTDMGCEVHVDCACAAISKCKVECILIVNADPGHWQFCNIISQLTQRVTLPIIVSGKALDDDWSKYNGQVIALDSMKETITFVSHITENLQDHYS